MSPHARRARIADSIRSANGLNRPVSAARSSSASTASASHASSHPARLATFPPAQWAVPEAAARQQLSTHAQQVFPIDPRIIAPGRAVAGMLAGGHYAGGPRQ